MELMRTLFEKSDSQTSLFAILDAARSRDIWLRIDETEHFNLFPPKYAGLLEEASPYLVKLDEKSSFTKWLIESEFGNSSILFLYSKESIETLARFFTRYTLVKVEGKAAFFAFYDPRVFRRFMRNADKEELEDFFGNVETYACEKGPEEMVLVCYEYDGELQTRECPV